MPNEKHYMMLIRQGVKAWNEWREESPGVTPDLSGANLTGLDLSEANFKRANLTGAEILRADCGGADLSGADLTKARLVFSDFMRTSLSGANLSGAYLMWANLIGADLSGADLSGANLYCANLMEANLEGANLKATDLSITTLITADLDRATLTDAVLWQTQRAGWSIKDIVCERVYWELGQGEKPTDYAPGEFEKLYSERLKIVLNYPGGISRVELTTLPMLIRELERSHACTLRLMSVNEAAGGARVEIAIEDAGEESVEILQASVKEKAFWQRKALEERNIREGIEKQLQERDEILYPLLREAAKQRLLASVNKQARIAVMFLDATKFSQMTEAEREVKVDLLRAQAVVSIKDPGGVYINTWGDGIVAGFDNLNDALLCACKFMEHLKVERIDVRIGMTYGEARVRFNQVTERLDIDGDSINLGARLEPLAEPGEVLISKELREHPDVKEANFEFTRQERRLKKAIGDKPADTIFECYSVRLKEE